MTIDDPFPRFDSGWTRYFPYFHDHRPDGPGHSLPRDGQPEDPAAIVRLGVARRDAPLDSAALKAYTGLKALALDGRKLTDDDLKVIRQFPQLQWLSLNTGWISDAPSPLTEAALAPLRDRKTLTHLSVKAGTKKDAQWITNKAMAHLADLTNLEGLALVNHRNLKGPGFKKLKKLKKLRTVDLTGSRVGVGLDVMADCPLEELQLNAIDEPHHYGNTPINEKATGSLAQLTSLQRLSMRYCVKIKELSWIQSMTRLQILDLEYSYSIQDADALAPLAALPALAVVNLLGVSSVLNGGLAGLQDTRSIRAIRIGTYKLGDDHLTALSQITPLRWLHFRSPSSNAFARFSPKCWQRLTQLEGLVLERTSPTFRRSGIELGPAHLEAIASLPLKVLKFRQGAAELTAQDLTPFKKMTQLQWLHLEDCQAAASLQDALPDCRITTSLHDWTDD